MGGGGGQVLKRSKEGGSQGWGPETWRGGAGEKGGVLQVSQQGLDEDMKSHVLGGSPASG